MSLFIKLTLVVAAVVVAFVVLGFMLKILIFAAIVAALVAAGMFGVAAIRRRFGSPSGAVMTYKAPRQARNLDGDGERVNPLFVAVDLFIAIIALRSLTVLRARAPWTSAGWLVTLAYGITAAAKYSKPGLHRDADIPGYAMLLAMTVAFVVAALHDEPQATPYWWPRRAGKTRAERRSDGGA